MHASSTQAAHSSIMTIEAYLASRNLTIGPKPAAKIIKIEPRRTKYAKHHKPVSQFDHIDDKVINKEETRYINRMFMGKVIETMQPTAQSTKEAHHEMSSKDLQYDKMDQPMFKGVERNYRRQPVIQIGSLAPYIEGAKKKRNMKKEITN